MTHSIAAIEELVLRLEKVREERPGGLGVCGALAYIHPWSRTPPNNVWVDTRQSLFRKWPLFSGNLDYPVPAAGHPMDAFDDATGDGTMWEGEYGTLRLELLDFLISEYRSMMERARRDIPDAVGSVYYASE